MLVEDQACVIEFNGVKYDSRHGGPFDRGSADSWYSRPRDPHFFLGDSYSGHEVTRDLMTKDQIDAYLAGYAYNEQHGGKKDWN
jgi:hypothetical protein